MNQRSADRGDVSVRSDRDAPGGLPLDSFPPEPAVAITALARTLAAVHDGVHPGLDVDRLVRLDPAGALEEVSRAVDGGWAPPPGSPYGRVEPRRLLEVLSAGVDRATERSGHPVPTVGRATFVNLTPLDPSETGAPRSGSGVDVAANITFHRRRAALSTHRFVDVADAAVSDPHRDLAVAAADVVTTFGAGAVIGFVEAYVTARPSVDQLDPILLDWWSMVAAVIAPAPAATGPSASGS